MLVTLAAAIIVICVPCVYQVKTMTKNQQGDKTTNPLEQYVILAKNAKGAAAAELIKQVLETPGVHVFGELLDMPNILELANGEHKPYFDTLNLFAYGTYKSYRENLHMFIDLSPNQLKKLQHLTVVTLATRLKCIPYSLLLEELDVKNVRDLEDLIIEAIYSDIIQGKLDQKNSQLEVDYAIGRDIKREDIGGIIKTLQEWCQSCETVLASIEEQVDRANTEKTACIQHRESIQQEIANIKKTLKATMDTEDSVGNDNRETNAQNADKMKKTAKTSKGLRGPAKFWTAKS